MKMDCLSVKCRLCWSTVKDPLFSNNDDNDTKHFQTVVFCCLEVDQPELLNKVTEFIM